MLSYAPALASRTTVVEVLALTLEIDRSWVRPRDVVRFRGRLTRDGVGYGGQEITIRIASVAEGAYVDVVSGTTDADGYYVIPWTVPWEGDWTTPPEWLVGKAWTFRAIHYPSYTQSPTATLTIAYPTRIDISAPESAPPAKSFMASGYLYYEASAGVWEFLTGRTVNVVYDETPFGSGATGTDGQYRITGSIPTSGTYTLTARYAGEGLPLAGMWLYAPAEAEMVLSIQIMDYGILIGAAAPLITVAAVLIGNEVLKAR